MGPAGYVLLDVVRMDHLGAAPVPRLLHLDPKEALPLGRCVLDLAARSEGVRHCRRRFHDADEPQDFLVARALCRFLLGDIGHDREAPAPGAVAAVGDVRHFHVALRAVLVRHPRLVRNELACGRPLNMRLLHRVRLLAVHLADVLAGQRFWGKPEPGLVGTVVVAVAVLAIDVCHQYGHRVGDPLQKRKLPQQLLRGRLCGSVRC